jgi:hypothetical protein
LRLAALMRASRNRNVSSTLTSSIHPSNVDASMCVTFRAGRANLSSAPCKWWCGMIILNILFLIDGGMVTLMVVWCGVV